MPRPGEEAWWSPGKLRLRSIIIGLLSAGLALLLWNHDAFKELEAKTYDLRVKLLSSPGPRTDDIRLIYLDQAGLDWAEETMGLGWPWPREMYTPILDFLSRHGARAVAFDVLYTEQSFYGLPDDQSFGLAIASAKGFAGAAMLTRAENARGSWPTSVPEPAFKVEGLGRWVDATPEAAWPRMVFPIPQVSKEASVLCNVQASPDPDTVYRRIRLLNDFDGRPVPSLGLGCYLASDPDVPLKVEAQKMTFDGTPVELDRLGQAILNFRGHGAYKSFSAAAVIQSELRMKNGQEPTIDGKAAFRGKFVFFGFTAPGLYDLRPTPMGGVTPGAVLAATSLDNLLSGDFVTRPSTPVLAGLCILLALATSLTLASTEGALGSIIINLIAVLLPAALCIGAYVQRIWLPFMPLAATVIPAGFGVSILKFATQGKKKRFIKNAFKQYLSPQVIEQILEHPERLTLGGERRELTIFFSDLQGFTSISEKLDPELLTSVLNDYLSAMTDIIQEEGGTVDKYEGDAIIAFWNAPLDQPDHGLRGVRAALRCQVALSELRPGLRERTGSDFHMRIGINTGHAVVGNMGSHSRFDYTMLGDAVNLAARLEGINKKFGTYTMISEDTLAECTEDICARELGLIRVVGKNKPVRVLEPMFRQEFVSRQQEFTLFEQALALFRIGGFKQAAELFDKTADTDPAALHYRKKCEEFWSSPPEKWDGVWNMTSK